MIRVLQVASECFPLVKTGGLADVVGALPGALAGLDCEVRTLLPAYPAVLAGLSRQGQAATIADLFGGPASLVAGEAGTLPVLALDAPHLFDRPGNPYLGPDGSDWPDNSVRFAALCRVAAMVGADGAAGWRPDIVHAHDWQAGLAPAYLAHAGTASPKTVMTVHNIAFQGLAPAADLAMLGLPGTMFTAAGLEYYGRISFLKAGLVFADRLTTVSPTYAQETRTPAFGMGMEGVLNARAAVYSGILNGVDVTVWDPETDPALAATYSRRRPAGKAANKAALQTLFGLAAEAGALLFGVVSRLTEQKGIDLLLEALPQLVAAGGQLCVLGSGNADLERRLTAAAEARPDAVGVRIGYDEALAHLIQGGADAILVPSRFEPCGLTQLYGLRYGSLPVVARTGGLADTVIDANEAAIAAGTATGFQFAPVDADGLRFALERVFAAWAEPKLWRRARARAMAHPVSWEKPAEGYAALYRTLLSSG